jgi:hypothetical protein
MYQGLKKLELVTRLGFLGSQNKSEIFLRFRLLKQKKTKQGLSRTKDLVPQSFYAALKKRACMYWYENQ